MWLGKPLPIYRPCMANDAAGTKLGAASRGQNPNLESGVIHGGRSLAVEQQVVLCVTPDPEPNNLSVPLGSESAMVQPYAG